MDATAKWLVTLLDLCVCHPCVSDCLSQLKVNLKAQLSTCILEVYTVGNLLHVSKLLYSLEALQPTEAAASKLDTFQLKGLRKILKMSTTYIDRTNTNHEVYRRANLEMGRGAEEIIRPLRDVLQEKRRKVLGHIIRRPRDHPQHQATFATRNLLPQQVEQRRVGRPRAAWTYETMKDCWRRKFHNIPFQIQNREHREQIKTWALNREDPFWQSF